MTDIFRRSTARKVEIRSDAEGKSIAHGYAAVFYNSTQPGTQYELWEGCVERIMPGAFDRAIRENQDVRALFNHDEDHLLGRVSAGTCRLSVDAIGLKYEIDLPDNAIGNNVRVSLGRGDLRESSFSFAARRNGKITWTEETVDGKTLCIRQVEDCDLFDIGPVTFAAYDASTAAVRSDSRRELEQERQEYLGPIVDEVDAVDMRAREVFLSECEL